MHYDSAFQATFRYKDIGGEIAPVKLLSDSCMLYKRQTNAFWSSRYKKKDNTKPDL